MTTSAQKLLIVESARTLRGFFDSHVAKGLLVDSVDTPAMALETLRQNHFDAIVVAADDLGTCATPTHELLEFVARGPRETTAIVVSDSAAPSDWSNGTSRLCWIHGSIADEQVCHELIRHAVARRGCIDERSDSEFCIPFELEGIVTGSIPMREVIQQILEAAAIDAPVLISGETGTGKDLVAAAIHKRSGRKSRNYVPVNMGALPTELIASELFGHEKGAYTGAADLHHGIFEQARGGSVFLDEITTMDERTQVALLRVLETKTVRRVGGSKDLSIDARIIAATNENIEERVKARRFREDLFYRLDVFRIDLPPLRERAGGVSILTNHFISRFDTLYKKNIRSVAPEVYEILRNYGWPGNVRELKNAIQRAVVKARGAELTVNDLPSRIRDGAAIRDVKPEHQPIQLGLTLEQVEREYITRTLASVRGNKLKAATVLGISRRTLYDKLKKYGLL